MDDHLLSGLVHRQQAHEPAERMPPRLGLGRAHLGEQVVDLSMLVQQKLHNVVLHHRGLVRHAGFSSH
jgi:hypothetical protein